ncbi:MAG: malonyl-ACP O-methyltransferase BioC [Burkholderiales bacterium]
MNPDNRVDKRALRRAFGRAAPTYEIAAVLQETVGARALERLQWVKVDPLVILDAGSGVGGSAPALATRFPRATVVQMEIAPEMLGQARARWLDKRYRGFGRLLQKFLPRMSWLTRGGGRQVFLCGDNEQMSLRSTSVDLLWSNLSFQWANKLESVFSECRRVLRPGGLLMFSTLGPDTLKELRQAFAADATFAHVHRFPDMHDVGDFLVQAGFGDPVMDMETLTLTYSDLNGLLKDLKANGAQYAGPDRRRGLASRKIMAQAAQGYERFRDAGRLPATFEVIYGHAWKSGPRTGPGGRPVIDIQLRR